MAHDKNNQSFDTVTQWQDNNYQLDYLNFVGPTSTLDMPTSADSSIPLNYTTLHQYYPNNTNCLGAVCPIHTIMGTQSSFENFFEPMFDPVSVHCGTPSLYQGLSYTSLSFPSHHDRLQSPEPSSNSPKSQDNYIHQARDQPRPPSTQKSRQVLPRKCSLCDQSFTSNRDLNRHLWSKHPTYAAAADVPSQQSSCHIPGCTYTGRRDNVLRHIRLKHPGSE